MGNFQKLETGSESMYRFAWLLVFKNGLKKHSSLINDWVIDVWSQCKNVTHLCKKKNYGGKGREGPGSVFYVYWLLSPVLLDWPRFLSSFPSMASQHVWHTFLHSSPNPAILGSICLFEPTQVLFMCHGL